MMRRAINVMVTAVLALALVGSASIVAAGWVP